MLCGSSGCHGVPIAIVHSSGLTKTERGLYLVHVQRLVHPPRQLIIVVDVLSGIVVPDQVEDKLSNHAPGGVQGRRERHVAP
jgi:hypothetical protein